MCLLSCLCKVVLVVVNVSILLLSLAMVVCGLIVVAGKDIYNSLLSSVKDGLNSFTNNFGLAVNTSNMSFTPFMLPLAYVIIAVGTVLGSLALVGCIGSCCGCRCILIVYVILLAAIFLAQLIAAAVFFVGKGTLVSSSIKPALMNSLSKFSGIEGRDAASVTWNGIMHYAQCCGVNSYKDFKNLRKWPPKAVGNMNVSLETPIACCKTKSTDFNCATTGKANSTNNWMETGCYNKIFTLVGQNPVVLTIVGILFAFQACLIVFTIITLCIMSTVIL